MENSHHAIKNGLSKCTITPIIGIRKRDGKRFAFKSIGDAAKKINGNKSNIHKVLVGTYKSAYGFCWYYHISSKFLTSLPSAI